MSTSSPSTTQRRPTFRTLASSFSSISDDGSHQPNIREDGKLMVHRANEGTPFTDAEIKGVCNSIQNLLPQDAPVKFDDLKQLLKDVAHLSHKNWDVTSENSDKLSNCLSISSDDEIVGSSPITPHAQQLLERILKEGNWNGAIENAPLGGSNQEKPWAVLVTGVNGIRKTTSLYQPWFDELLEEAICCPSGTKGGVERPKNLPTGSNSFFRQLDHMIATLCNEEFCKLYYWAKSQLSSDKGTLPSNDVVQGYSEYKAAIFSRYRTLSELLGALLLKQANKVNINCLMETSGKDVAMFHYVDHFFDASKYNKLALHFTINDLECAKQSVDRRMTQEIQNGAKAIKTQDAFDITYTNAGGPYGSKVLPGIQEASDEVWQTRVMGGEVGSSWYKATIAINAHPTEPWTAQAVKPDGSLSRKFTFERK